MPECDQLSRKGDDSRIGSKVGFQELLFNRVCHFLPLIKKPLLQDVGTKRIFDAPGKFAEPGLQSLTIRIVFARNSPILI